MTIQTTLPEEFPTSCAEQLLRLLRDYEVSVLSATCWYEDASWTVPERQLNDIMLLAPIVGALQATIDGKAYAVSATEVLIVAEGQRQQLELAPGCQAIEQIGIHCHIAAAWQPPLLPLLACPVQPLVDVTAWHRRLRQLVSLMNDRPLGQEYGAMLIKELLAERLLAGAELLPANAEIDPRIVAALKRIHRDYAKELTVGELAAQARLSTVHFRKLFQQDFHQSPKQYIISHRLKLAAQLLRTTAKTAQEIAFETGFNSEGYFHRCFRQAHRMTPLEYRAGRSHSV